MRRAVTVWAWLGLALATPVAARAQAQSGLKIAFVSYQTILQQTPGYTAAESTFNKEVLGYRNEVQKLQQQLDSAVRTFDQQAVALSPAAKQAKQRDLQQLQQRFEQRNTELQDKAQQRQRELLQPIQARVTGVIQGIRAEGNYQLILDADVPGVIVAADPTLDITSKVIARLKQPQ